MNDMNLRLLDFGLYQIYKNLGVVGTSYDVQENDEQFIITIGVPGLVRSDIDITIRGGKRMVIKSKRSTKFTPDFSYVFHIPCKVIKDETFATVKEGVLTVFIQKAEDSDYKVELK
jgi:HSP20 family molecular chaperone IbpA